MPRFVASFLAVAFFVPLSGCAQVYSHMNSEDKLDEQLSIPMSKSQLLEALGKPDETVRDDGRRTDYVYMLYPRMSRFEDFVICPLAFWLGPCSLYPLHHPKPYHVILIDDQLCMWGPPQVIETRKTCKAPIPAKDIVRGTDNGKETTAPRVEYTISPVLMPPQITTPVGRLAVVPVGDPARGHVAVLLDTVLNFLRTRHPNLVVVERDLNPVLDEMTLQNSGRVDDSQAVRIGQLSGADSLLTYFLDPTGSVELRLVQVETGVTLFRQAVSATVTGSAGEARTRARQEAITLARQALRERGLDDSYLADMVEVTKQQIAMEPGWFDRRSPAQQHRELAREVQLRAQAGTAKRGTLTESGLNMLDHQVLQVAMQRAVGYALAGLVAAFGDNPMGIVPLLGTEGAGVLVLGLLDGGPAHAAGLKKGDRILAVNGRPFVSWTTPVSLPAALAIDRDSQRQEITVR